MNLYRRYFQILLCLVLLVNLSFAQTSSLVSYDSNGDLIYTPDADGNIIPDFSMVGYHNGEIEIPDVPVVLTLNPSSGDRLADIQNAINTVSAMSPDANGHRGAILLTAGYYEVSAILNVNASGIVIRGEGSGTNGTVVELTATTQTDLFHIGGTGNPIAYGSTEKLVTDSHVPVGAKTFSVEAGHTFQVGERVLFYLTPNASWLATLGADQLATLCGEGHVNWSIITYKHKRKIVAVNGNEITLDASIVDPVDSTYNTASLVKYYWNHKIEECGVENIRLQSSYVSEDDENHGWTAIKLNYIENAWVRNVDVYYFGFNAVALSKGAYQVTVSNCGMYEYKSIVTGGRRYGFYMDDNDLCLVKDCVATFGRHDFSTGSSTIGPNVFYNCTATDASNDCGPHHRWATGTLYDNVSTNNALNVQNRECSGSGHGWAGAQQVFWNCTADKIILHDPPSKPTNWAIGCTANITNVGAIGGIIEPLGFVESQNSPIVDIPSLYEAQFADRFCGNTISQVCDDNNPCTKYDRIVLSAFNPSIECKPCKGTTVITCKNTISQTCDDGNLLTENDVVKVAACDTTQICIPCKGTPVNFQIDIEINQSLQDKLKEKSVKED